MKVIFLSLVLLTAQALALDASGVEGNYTLSVTECEPGQYFDIDQLTCSLCPIGTFSHGQGATECTPCPAGSYGDAPGQETCDSCPPGTFSSSESSQACSLCPVNTFGEWYGMTSCTPCQDGTFTPQAGSTTCSICMDDENAFFPEEPIMGCSACQPEELVEYDEYYIDLWYSFIDYEMDKAELVESYGMDLVGFETFTLVDESVLAESIGKGEGGWWDEWAGTCPLGYMDAGEDCYPCEPGTFNDERYGSTCDMCPDGTWSSQYGASSCQSCLETGCQDPIPESPSPAQASYNNNANATEEEEQRSAPGHSDFTAITLGGLVAMSSSFPAL